MIFGLQPAEQASSATNCGPIPFRKSPQPSGRACTSGPMGREDAALRPGAAAGCSGSFRNRKFRIQNSRFKIANRGAACGGASDTMELRASAAPRLRPARPFQGRNPKFRIQYEMHADTCGIESDRGAGLPALRPPPRFSLPEIHLQQLLGGDERRNLLFENALFEHADPLFDGRVVVE